MEGAKRIGSKPLTNDLSSWTVDSCRVAAHPKLTCDHGLEGTPISDSFLASYNQPRNVKLRPSISMSASV